VAVQAQAIVYACWLAAMARASNSASIPEVVKCIRANFDSFELAKESNPEKVVALYKKFLLDLLQVTSRPLKNLLSKSLLKAFEKVCPSLRLSSGPIRLRQLFNTAGLRANP